jgi:hypothetical protein
MNTLTLFGLFAVTARNLRPRKAESVVRLGFRRILPARISVRVFPGSVAFRVSRSYLGNGGSPTMVVGEKFKVAIRPRWKPSERGRAAA